jgi:hypothetical protein
LELVVFDGLVAVDLETGQDEPRGEMSYETDPISV